MAYSISRRNWLEINLDNLVHNYTYLSSLCKNYFLPVVKANAYSNGIKRVVTRLVQEKNATRFAVAAIIEAVQLRVKLNLALSIDLISLSPVIDDENIKLICKHNIIPVISNQITLEKLIHYLAKNPDNKPIPIWLKINSGMNRLGININQAKKIIESIEVQYSNLVEIKMMMTHLSSAEENPEVFTQQQISQFNHLMTSLKKTYPTSIGNSAFLLNPEINTIDTITRSGLALYGISPFYQEIISDELQKICNNLKPTASLKAKIIAIATIKTGEYVGYSRKWQAKRQTKIATVSIGYADGYPRNIKNETKVMVNNQITYTIGVVSMDCLSISLAGISAQIGDEVTLWGNGLDINEIANSADTIAYDILTRANPRGGTIYLN